jgi:hypothetical protein
MSYRCTRTVFAAAAGLAGVMAGTSASAAAFVYENFESYDLNTAIGNQGPWQESRTGTGPGEGVVEETGLRFEPGDNPFGDPGDKVLTQNSGKDSAINFTALPAGDDLYFSFNFLALDSGNGSHTATFFNTSTTPFMSLEGAAADTEKKRDLILKAQNNTQTLTDAIVEDDAVFIYGKLTASNDLKTWTFSANIDTDIANIDSSEPVTWDLQQSQTYSSARSSHANILALDTGGSPGRAIYDAIRLGDTYADVTNVPEPASLALIGLGGVLMLGRRRSA